MVNGLFMKALSLIAGRGKEYSGRNIAPRALTEEEKRPITQGLSALLEEGVRSGTFPNGAETPEELAEKGLIKRGLADVQLA